MWHQIQTYGDVPSPRTRFGYTYYQDKEGTLLFAIFGGITATGLSNSLYLLNTTSWKWKKMPSEGIVPKSVAGPTINYYSNKIYIAAGEVLTTNITIQTLFYYDLDANQWVNVTSKNTYTARTHHGSVIYEDELYLMMGWSQIENNHVLDWYKVNLKDPNYDWNKVSLTDDTTGYLKTSSYGSTLYQNSIYLFGGNQYPPTTNELVIFDMAVSPIPHRTFGKDLSPTPRMYHSMQPIGQYLYLFGGLGDNGHPLNDFWSFDCINENWSLVSSFGDHPLQRYAYASAVDGDLLLIWGGYGSLGYLNDGYVYDITSNTWTILEYTGVAPSPRSGACAGMSGPMIFIYGGETELGLSDEVWYYDFTVKMYTLLDSDNPRGPGPLVYASCRIATTSNTYLYVMYGEAEDNIATNAIYGFFALTGEWFSYIDNPDNQTYSRSRAAVCKPQGKILIAGGIATGGYPNNDIFYFDTKNKQYSTLGSLRDSVFGPASVYFQNYFYIHGGGSAVSYLLRYNAPTNKFIRMHLWSSCSNNVTCSFGCSPGSYRTASNCEICPQGAYADQYNMTECTKCPKGKYGPNYGSTSADMCYPCQEGTYNALEGQRYCLACPSGSSCKTGSSYYSHEIEDFSDKSIQPAIYSVNMSETNRNIRLAEYVIGFIGLGVILIFIFVKKAKKLLKYIDLYVSSHNYILGDPMILRSTQIGGVFSLAFIFGAIIIIFISIFQYASNNIYETKSLVPLVVLEQDVSEFTSYFLLNVTLKNYGSTCAGESNSCYHAIFYEINGITGEWSEESCKEIPNGDCQISMVCKHCSIPYEGSIFFTMDDTNAYTSGYTVNFTSSSSIPDKPSSYQTSVLPSKNYVFLGTTPTKIYYTMIPSFYDDKPNDVNHTGYHVTLGKLPDKGSQLKSYELGMGFINYLSIVLSIDNSGLVTTRNDNQTLIVLLTTLIGSVFGILSGIGGVMNTVEQRWIKFKKKSKMQKHCVGMVENIKYIENSYVKKLGTRSEGDTGLNSNDESGNRLLRLIDKYC
ncbi:unnamed protein product [Blepharisma stoltei]|uniref:Tyrosine-protein kinase ephrin type A/B receptor-like domain-containing protein n=1 Tax=Blepharisma stoltei TaxID=1481888 RepID=A0AAU9KKI8_9CILI|nr:unnamed protein product [Blepharisma stoltei]